MRRSLSVITLVASLILDLSASLGAVASEPGFLRLPASSELPGHGAFIMSMCCDQHGATWIGTEEEGIWRYDPALPTADRWKKYTIADGLGDNNGYSLVCDKLGRIWAGHGRTGLSVYNGQSWKHYDQVSGPLGAHVYAMAVSPVSGDVWTASELGLCRYRAAKDDWRYSVSPPGISLLNVTGIAFDHRGNVVVGTQTDGIAIGDASSDFEQWIRVQGPATPLNIPAGEGLPTSQINSLIADMNGRLWAGTHDGLAWSTDGGVSWKYLRGADFASKASGLYANRQFQAQLCGFDLFRQDSDGNAIVDGHSPHVVAGVPVGDQFGVHIAVAGGQTRKIGWPIDVSRVQMPGDQAFYQSYRVGDFTYMLSGLRPGAPYVLRLHFAEAEYRGSGQRKLDVSIAGQTAISGLDIFQEAGFGAAIVKMLPVVADGKGSISFRLLGTGSAAATAVPLPTEAMLAEDYVSCLAPLSDGRIVVGHWTKGAEIYDPTSKTLGRFEAESVAETLDDKGKARPRTDFVSSLLALSDGSGVLLGCYGDGLRLAGTKALVGSSVPDDAKPIAAKTSPDTYPSFPSTAAPPTDSELAALDAQVTNEKLSRLSPGEGAYLGSDWATGGDWVGRYGSRYAMLCAAGSPFDHEIINDFSYKVTGDIGPNRGPRDGLRHWIQWLRTDQQRVLYDPIIGTRREAEWDDHGEAYPWDHEGPDVWATVTVPAGIHKLSAYFVNKDGHGGANRQRDYLLQLLPWRGDMRESLALEPLGQARVRVFWGGVYHSFAVCGPAKFYLRVARNASFNTILCSVMLDKVSGPPTKFETKYPGLHSVYFFTPLYQRFTSYPAGLAADTVRGSAALLTLWQNLELAYVHRALCPQIAADRMLCYRALVSAPGIQPKRCAWWRRKLPMATDDDRKTFADAMTAMFQDELKLVPTLKNPKL